MTVRGHRQQARATASPVPPRRGRGPCRRRAWSSLLLLLAFVWQAIAVQSHVHPSGRTVSGPSVSAATPGIGTPPEHPAGGDPATCPLCRELAQAGRYLPGVPPLWPPPPIARPWRSRTLARRWRLRKRSHAWLSRGPPARIA